MNQSKFALALRRGNEHRADTHVLFQAVREASVGQGSLVEADVAKAGISMEGYTDSVGTNVESALTRLQSLVETAFSHYKGELKGKETSLTVAQEAAAVTGAMIASAPKAYASQRRFGEAALSRFAGVSGNEVTRVVGHSRLADAREERAAAFEAYDERANRDVVAYSVAYNLQAARQNEFGEALFPTVVIAPDQVGFNIQLRLLLAYSEVQRQVTGATNNFNRKNLIRAIIDATILQVQQTQLIPIYRTGAGQDSSANFVSGITPTTLTVDGQPLTTAPLAFGATFSLLGISQTSANVAAGLEDQTDAIDSSVRLQNVYLKLYDGTHTEYFQLNTQNLPTSDFNAAPQGNTRRLQLNFSENSILLSSSTKTVSNATSVILAGLGTNTVRLSANINGYIVQDVGDTNLSANAVGVYAINDSTGAALDPTTGTGATIAAMFAGANATYVGYDLLAYRTDSNRRNRGKLIDVQHVNYLYTVPLLPPITALRPVMASDANDGNLLSDLVTATRIQTSNAAVTALLNAQSALAANASAMDVVTNWPQLFGPTSSLVVPSYMTAAIDCSVDIDSLASSQRAADLQALLVNKIRDMAMLLWVQSGYGPASEAMYEGQAPKPVVIIATDPIIARYLQLTGDTRLVGDMFDYKIVASFDSRMTGQLIFSFGQESAFNSGVVNPLHFGTMAWRPELTVMLPMVRNGAQSMELTVQPSYRHVVNLPVMGAITVTNISSVIGGKVAIDMHSI